MRIKILYVLCLLGLLVPSALAQELYTADQLDDLVGPVALYPDPLLTNVLTAATVPDQVKAAQAYLDAGKPVGDKVDTGFDSSVNALLIFPDVVAMLNDNADWTASLGWAVGNQESDVMEAVQRFRLQAKSAGNLDSNDKMNVIEEGTVIRIEPADPQVIYVPTYQPSTVIVQQPDTFGTVLTYSAAIATNILLWNRVVNWHDYRFYGTPYGWRPAAGYYRPYGWRGSNVYASGRVYSPRTTVVNRPVNINNNFNNINVRGGGNNVRVGNNNRVNNNNRGNNNRVGNNNRPTTRPSMPSQRPDRIQPKPNPRVSQPRNVNNRRPGQRPEVGNKTSTRPTSRPATKPPANRGSRAGNYSRTGGTVRASNRGARSRGTRSHSGGGARRSRGGGRRR